MKRIAFTLLAALIVVAAHAQLMEPVHFQSRLEQKNDQEAWLVFTATIDDGWHVYSTRLGSDGPTEASLHIVKLDGARLVGALQPVGQEVKQYDAVFGAELRYFEHRVTFRQRLKPVKPRFSVDCYLEYGVCSSEMCLPPTQVELKAEGRGPSEDTALNIEESPQRIAASGSPADTTPPVNADAAPQMAVVGSPADTGTTAANPEAPAIPTSPLRIFLLGFVGGLLALLTPCVWPVIPMTVSFFLKRNTRRSKAVSEALVYGLSIVVIYVALGLLVTLLFGASALNAMATNAVFNIFFFLLLTAFAASFFGAFELTLPAAWSNAIDAKADRLSRQGGSHLLTHIAPWLALFLMAFTLVLVSFSCTGPIIGFLLVAVSMDGNIIAPTVGMLGFAVALAIPFALFALFPSWLKAAPKSGSWMNTVKVCLGFIELAFALKFLSVADLAYGWHLLDREVFLSLWVIIFGLMGCYLLGWIRLPHDAAERRTSVPQLFLAICSLAFTVYMVPGLWGAPLKAISAFAPPLYTQDFKLSAVPTASSPTTGTSYVEARFRDYDEALLAARQEGKPLMLDFTGYGCVNCRKMEAAVWTNPEVARLLTERYVLVSLYVDDKTPLPEPITVTEAGQQRTLRTVGDKWSHFQRSRFGANAQPFYVLLDADGRQTVPARGYDEDVAAYVEFLHKGLQ